VVDGSGPRPDRKKWILVFGGGDLGLLVTNKRESPAQKTKEKKKKKKRVGYPYGGVGAKALTKGSYDNRPVLCRSKPGKRGGGEKNCRLKRGGQGTGGR